MTNPAAVESLKQTLNECMGKYGIDGFKFDAGDIAILANGECRLLRQECRPKTFSPNDGPNWDFPTLSMNFEPLGKPEACH